MVDREKIRNYTRDVIRGLVLLEGSLPVDHLNPALKHIVHYGPQTDTRGILDWFAMWAFERNNKRVKTMVNNTVQPLSSIANHVELDIKTRMKTLTKKVLDRDAEIALSVRIRGCVLSDKQRAAMEFLGATSFRDVKFFKVDIILGVHFRCGEWGSRRCGSVITTMYAGVSRYCILDSFVMVQDKTYACVTWLSRPIYPCPPFKIVVKVRLLTPLEGDVHRCVIPADKIDPTKVSVLPASDGIHYFMLREKGIDRT